MKITAILLLCLSYFAVAEEVVLTPAKDTDVYSYPGDGAPTSTTFTLGVNSSPIDFVSVHSQRSLIQFPLSGLSIPAAEIGSAKLRLFVLPPNPEYGVLSPGDIHVHRQGSDWGNITLATPKWTAFDSAEILGTFPILVTSAEQWVEFDLTSTVIAWAEGTHPNHGIYLATAADRTDPVVNVSFASMEFPGYGPQLVIQRRIVPPELAIESESGTVTLQWPVTGSEGWVLERADSPAGPWIQNSESISSAEGQWRLQTAALTREFFRLAKY